MIDSDTHSAMIRLRGAKRVPATFWRLGWASRSFNPWAWIAEWRWLLWMRDFPKRQRHWPDNAEAFRAEQDWRGVHELLSRRAVRKAVAEERQIRREQLEAEGWQT